MDKEQDKCAPWLSKLQLQAHLRRKQLHGLENFKTVASTLGFPAAPIQFKSMLARRLGKRKPIGIRWLFGNIWWSDAVSL